MKSVISYPSKGGLYMLSAQILCIAQTRNWDGKFLYTSARLGKPMCSLLARFTSSVDSLKDVGRCVSRQIWLNIFLFKIQPSILSTESLGLII